MEITLEKIELVKDRTGVSYKEAKEALEAADGSVVDAIIAIEETVDVKPGAKANAFAAETVAKIKDFVRKGNISKITVQKGDTTIVNVPVNVGVVGAIVAPWGMIAAAIAAFGFSCKITLTTTDGKHIDMMAKGTDVVNNVKEKAPIVANNVASEVAGTYDKIKDAAADKYNEFKAKKEACVEEADDDDEEWEEFCEKVEDFCDHISDAAGDMAATAAKKAGDAAEQLSETLTEVADEAREASDKIKEKNGFWSIFAGKKKEETEAQKKEESAPAEAETKTEDKASADPADTAKSDASEE